jgi:hypothetical protein
LSAAGGCSENEGCEEKINQLTGGTKMKKLQLLSICAVAAGLILALSAVAQAATVNVSLEPTTGTVVQPGDTFELKLWLKSPDGSTIVFDDAHLLLEWYPAYVSFSGSASTADGDYDWTTAMSFMTIVQPMYQFEGSASWNETYDDGDAKINLYPCFAGFQGMSLPQTDLKALTLTFTALAVTDSTVIAIRPMTYAECGVNSGIVGPSGYPIGGTGAGATVKICDPWTATCTGFEPPMDKGAVKVKKNRVLPLKAELLDDAGNILTDAEITAPPVIQVMFDPVAGGDVEDVTEDALSAGQGDDGNQFVFTGSNWQFNLKTKNYSAPGTYTITMESGDDCEYFIESTCTATFVIE